MTPADGNARDAGGVPRLRVLALTRVFPNVAQPTLGTFNAACFAHLSARAHVRVVAPIRWSPGWAPTPGPEGAVPARTRYLDLKVDHPRYPRIPRWARAWHGAVNTVALARPVARIVREHRPDVMLAAWAHDGVTAHQLGARLALPVVIKCLGSDVHAHLDDPKRRPELLGALARCAGIVTVSASLKALLGRAGIPESTIDVVQHGVDRAAFHPSPRDEARRALGLPREGPVLLCVAHLVPIKDHLALLRAFRRLSLPGRVPAVLVLLGDGPLRSALTAEAGRLGLADRVLFVGARPHAEVPRWMTASDVVCLASKNEGLPNVLVEALACGRPVVATRVGGVPELVTSERYGLLAESDDPAALGEALGEALRRPWDPAQLSACPQVIPWAQSAGRLLDVLQRAVDRRTPGGQPPAAP